MHVHVKICGITTPDDARAVASQGVDYIGLNFYAKSPRYVSAPTVRAILAELPSTVERVGLFVNESMAEVQRQAELLGLRAVQIHGEPFAALSPGPLRWIPAFGVKDAGSLERITSYLAQCRAGGAMPAAILLDAHVVGMFGGTGRVAPWEMLAEFTPGVPIILAGGLTPGNVAEAIRTVRPWAVDVASGVESAPGRKDIELVRRFIAAVREA